MQSPQNAHTPASGTPLKKHTCSHTPEDAGSCAWCPAGRLWQPDSRDTGCGKYASDQIQPAVSELSAKACGLPVSEKRPGSWPQHLCRPHRALPRMLCPRSCSLEVETVLAVRQCPKGHGHSAHQPSGLPGAKMLEPTSQPCLTGQGSLITHTFPFPRAGLGWTRRQPGPGSPESGDCLSMPASQLGRSPPHPLPPFPRFPSCLFLPVARRALLL